METVGMFVNTFALRVDTARSASVLALSREVQDQLLRALEIEHLPFPVVARDVDFPRDMSRNAIFQVCFSMNDWPEQQLDFGTDLLAETRFPSNGGAKFDLDVVLADPASFTFLWRYYAGLFSADKADCLIDEYYQLTGDLIASEDTELAPLLNRKD